MVLTTSKMERGILDSVHERMGKGIDPPATNESEQSVERERLGKGKRRDEPRAAMLKSSLKILQSRSFISSSGLSLQWRSSVPDLVADRRSSASAYLQQCRGD